MIRKNHSSRVEDGKCGNGKVVDFTRNYCDIDNGVFISQNDISKRQSIILLTHHVLAF